MRQVGYTKDFAAGVIGNAGTLGILIPPSIVMVVYASATDVSVGRMFLAGVIPGLLAGLMLMIAIYVAARIRRHCPRRELRRLGRDLGELRARRDLGAVADRHHHGRHLRRRDLHPDRGRRRRLGLRLHRATFVYRDMGPLATPRRRTANISLSGNGPRRLSPPCVHRGHPQRTLFDAGKLTITLMFIIANALILKHVLTDEQIPQQIAEAMLGAGFGKIMFLIMVNVILLIGGQFMEPSGLIVIVAPLVFPIAIELGVDPIHLGIIMVVNMEIGMITPPVGLNLFVTSGVAGMPMMRVVRAALPFLGVLFVFLIMVTYVPIVWTLLPTLFMGPELVIR